MYTHVAKCSAFDIKTAIEVLQDLNHQVLIGGWWICLNVVHSEQGEYVLYLQVAF